MACGRQWPQWLRIARAAVASAGADGDVAPGSSSAGEMPSDIGITLKDTDCIYKLKLLTFSLEKSKRVCVSVNL